MLDCHFAAAGDIEKVEIRGSREGEDDDGPVKVADVDR